MQDASIAAYHIQHFWMRNFVNSRGGREERLFQTISSLSLEYFNTSAFAIADHMVDSLYKESNSNSCHHQVDGVHSGIFEYFNLLPFDIGICYSVSTQTIHCSTFSFQELISRHRHLSGSSFEFKPLALSVFESLFRNPQALLLSLTCMDPIEIMAVNGYHETIRELQPPSIPLSPFTIRVFHRSIPNMIAINGVANNICTIAVGVHFLSSELAVAVIGFQRVAANHHMNAVTGTSYFQSVADVHDDLLCGTSSENAKEATSTTQNKDKDEFSLFVSVSSSKLRMPEIYKRRRVVDDEHTSSSSDGEGAANTLTSKIKSSQGPRLWVCNMPEEMFKWNSVMPSISSLSPKLVSAYNVPMTTVSPQIGLNPFPAPIIDDQMSKILRKCLNRTPFQLIELWLPANINGKTLLLFGGSATSNELLHGWSVYSRGFAFEKKEGIPGRIASEYTVEKYSDVGMLPVTKFLRMEGARQLGIRASVGFPMPHVVSTRTMSESDNSNADVPPIVVLYSVDAFTVTTDMVELCQRKLGCLSISTTVEAVSTTNTATTASATPDVFSHGSLEHN